MKAEYVAETLIRRSTRPLWRRNELLNLDYLEKEFFEGEDFEDWAIDAVQFYSSFFSRKIIFELCVDELLKFIKLPLKKRIKIYLTVYSNKPKNKEALEVMLHDTKDLCGLHSQTIYVDGKETLLVNKAIRVIEKLAKPLPSKRLWAIFRYKEV